MPSQYVGISDDEQNKLLIGADGSIAVTGSLSSGGSVTQGTPAAAANAWPVKVTDGTNSATVDATTLALGVLVRNTSNIPVQVSGTVPISGSVNQGSPAAIGGEWPAKVSDGTNFARVANSALGQSLLVSTGPTGATTSLTAAATGNGTTADFGAAKANISLAILVNGTVTSGTVRLEGSHDGTVWIPLATSAALGTGVNVPLSATGVAFRYAHAAVGTAIGGGGSVTVTIMAS